MNIIIVLLTTLDVMIALLLIGLILVQQSKTSGLGTTFGGGGSDSLFGAHANTHLVKLTVVFASCFLIITLSLAIITAHRPKGKSVAEMAIGKQADKPSQAVPLPDARDTQPPAAGDKPGTMQQQFKVDPATGQLVPVGEMTPAPAVQTQPAPAAPTPPAPGGTISVTPTEQPAKNPAEKKPDEKK